MILFGNSKFKRRKKQLNNHKKLDKNIKNIGSKSYPHYIKTRIKINYLLKKQLMIKKIN